MSQTPHSVTNTANQWFCQAAALHFGDNSKPVELAEPLPVMVFIKPGCCCAYGVIVTIEEEALTPAE